MSTKHTPGPWIVQDSNGWLDIVSEEKRVCYVESERPHDAAVPNLFQRREGGSDDIRVSV